MLMAPGLFSVTQPLSKAQLTEMHRESAVLQRSECLLLALLRPTTHALKYPLSLCVAFPGQNVCIEKKTKAPKSISELMARVK